VKVFARGIVLGVVVVVLSGCGSGSRAQSAPSTTTAPIVRPSTTTATTAPPTTSTTLPAPAIPPGLHVPTLGPGASGPLVVALQRRLVALGYWVQGTNGAYDDSTTQAVYAVQKAAHIPRDGVVGPATVAVLDARIRPQPRSRAGHVVEVDLADDLVLIVTGGHLDATLNTSTGGGYVYVSHGQRQVANTPVGRFTIYRQVDGLVVNNLGELWRPKFFDDGFAIHGDSSVPPVPVSHGCVRVSNEAIDWIWAGNVMPIGTPVWVY